MLILLILFQVEICTATHFAFDGDELAGGVAPYLGRKVRPTDNGIAHRTLPMGSKVVLINLRNGRKVTTRVIDRGPFGPHQQIRPVVQWGPLLPASTPARKAHPPRGLERLR